MLGITVAVAGSGRALPPVLAPRAKVPPLPALSHHEPLADGNVMRASTCTPRPPGVVDDVPAEADGAIRIRRGGADQWRALPRAALVVEAVEGVDRAVLDHVDGDDVAERLQLPPERAERLRLGGDGGKGRQSGGERGGQVSTGHEGSSPLLEQGFQPRQSRAQLVVLASHREARVAPRAP